MTTATPYIPASDKYRTVTTVREHTDLDADLWQRTEALGYRWWYAEMRSNEVWKHFFGNTWSELLISNNSGNLLVTVEHLRWFVPTYEEHYRFKAELKALGWASDPNHPEEWTQLAEARRQGGNIAQLVESFRQQRKLERDLEDLQARYWSLCDKHGYVVAVGRGAASMPGALPHSGVVPQTLAERVEDAHQRVKALETRIAQERQREAKNVAQNVRRWAKQGLSRNEMARRLGGDRNATLKLIRDILQQDARND